MRRLVLTAVVLASGVVAGTVLLLGRDGFSAALSGLAAVAGSVLVLVASGMLLLLWRRQAAKSAIETQPSHHDRTQMLNRVQQHWIKEGLDNSLKNQTQIALGRARRRGAILQRRLEVHRPDQEPEPLHGSTMMSEIFDEFSNGLLILGPPGSGKTTALLELTNDLLDRARQDAEQPIPVVFNLPAWSQHVQFGDWLVEELHHSYEVPRKIAQYWVNHNHILPLLDGLDELPPESRNACITAIQQFLSEHPVDLVVCGHADEYQTLATRLGLENAVVLQSLTRQQVYDYLETVGLSQAREALQADDRLWELVGSPLMLNIVALAYQGRTPHALLMDGTPAQRRKRLFADYIERMFARRPLTGRYAKDQAKHWLTQLAQAMRAHRQSEFDLDRMQPDWLPTAAQRRLVTLVPAIVSGLVSGLLVGLAARLGGELAASLGVGPGVSPGIELAKGPGVEVLAGLVFTLIAVGSGRDYEPVGRLSWPWGGLGVGLGVGMVAGLVGGVVVGLVFGLVAMGVGLVYELVHGDRIKDVRWSWSRLVAGVTVGVVVGLVGGVVVGLVCGLVAMGVGLAYELVRSDGIEGARATINPVEQLHWSRPRLGAGLGVGLLSGVGGGFLTVLARWLHGGLDVLRDIALEYGLGSGAVVAVAVVLAFVLGSGLGSGLADKAVTPNQGIHRSVRRGAVVGLVGWLGVVVMSVLVNAPLYALRFSGSGVGLATGLGVGLGKGLRFGLANGLANGLVLGLAFGLAVGLEFGGIAWLRHVTLRGLLVRNRFAPWRYVAFLDDMAERLFLHRSGGSYVFRHPLLLDYFADLEAEPSAGQLK